MAEVMEEKMKPPKAKEAIIKKPRISQLSLIKALMTKKTVIAKKIPGKIKRFLTFFLAIALLMK